MTTPTISVIVPTHNRPERVRKAVQSVLAQTFQDLEVIVVDDGMERRADAALQEIHDARVMYLQHDKNKGAAAARNTGIRAARAPYIAFWMMMTYTFLANWKYSIKHYESMRQ